MDHHTNLEVDIPNEVYIPSSNVDMSGHGGVLGLASIVGHEESRVMAEYVGERKMERVWASSELTWKGRTTTFI